MSSTPTSASGPLDTIRDEVRAGRIGATLRLIEQIDTDRLDDTERPVLIAMELDCRLARGDLGDATALGERLGRWLDLPGTAGAYAHHGRGALSAASGDPELAGAHFARVARLVGADDDPARLPWRAEAALAAVRSGRRAEAVALAREQLTSGHTAGSSYAVALGLRTLATVDAQVDHVGLLREALDLVTAEPGARLAAQIQADLAGLLLLGRGSEPEALTLLRAAEAYAGREELRPLQGRVRRQLLRMEQAPVLGAADRRAPLTAAELKVARLAAGGRTNREVAGELLVSVKAVEWHLSHAYRKLGIRSRGELAGALAEPVA